MPKFAELPDGKVLEFPDDASEKAIRRAVRRELGVLKVEDTLDGIETIAARMEKLFAGAFEQQNKRQRQALDDMADAFQANVNRLAGVLTDAIADMRKAQEKLGADLLKAMNGQANLITKLHVVMKSSNKTIDAALGQSLDALDKSVAVSGSSSKTHVESVNRLSELASKMTEVAQIMQSTAGMTRRAVREGPGVWTLEPVRRRLNG